MSPRTIVSLSLALSLALSLSLARAQDAEAPPERTVVPYPTELKSDPALAPLAEIEGEELTPKELHAAYLQAFVNIADSFGMTRLIILHVHGPSTVSLRVAQLGKRPAKRRPLERLELVSLLDPEARVVVDPKGIPSPPGHEGEAAEAHKTTRRALDAFEAEALVSLREGEEVVASADGGRLLGAVRARESCTRCHEVKVGELMGAFSYAFGEAIRD